jgi:hypothetical protein
MSGLKIALIVLGIGFGLLFIGGLLVGILAVAVTPKLGAAKEKLELKQMGDLEAGLRQIARDDAKKKRLKGPTLANAKGADFWNGCLENGLLDRELGRKLTSLNGTEQASEGVPLPASAISYTSPKGSDLLVVMTSKSSKRCVVFTWNSRNWRNLGGDQVPVVWSDGEMPVYMTFDEAQSDWGITRAEWDDPAGQLFGTKAPFQNTYE